MIENLLIYDNINILENTQRNLHDNESYEKGFLIVCTQKNEKEFYKISTIDFINIIDFGGKCFKDTISIPSHLTLAFMRICKEQNLIPFIMHTHRVFSGELQVSFSNKDIMFEQSVCKLSEKLLHQYIKIFCVINSYSFCFRFSTEVKHLKVLNQKGDSIYEY